MIIKNHFHKRGFALGLVSKLRLVASRKWPIYEPYFVFIFLGLNLCLRVLPLGKNSFSPKIFDWTRQLVSVPLKNR